MRTCVNGDYEHYPHPTQVSRSDGAWERPHRVPVRGWARTSSGSVRPAPEAPATVAEKESLNSDHAISPHGLIGRLCPSPTYCSGWHLMLGSRVLPASCASLRLRT